jgi:acyl dehydratase
VNDVETVGSAPEIRVGRPYERHEGRIDIDASVAFALATNDPNDIYLTGVVVPPIFTSALIQPAFAEAAERSVDPGAISGYSATVQAEHDVYFRAPIHPGASIKWQATTRSVRQTPAGVLLTQQILVTDDDQSPLVEHLWSTIYVGGKIEEELGPDLPGHAFPDGAHSLPLGGYEFDIAADQSFRYGGVSGDRVPHSIDDVAAQADGFPGKIVQGQCIFAMCSGAVVRIFADGEPRRLLRLAGRFSSPVFPRQQLAIDFYDAGTRHGNRILAFEARSGGATVMKHGLAELQPN